MAVTPAEAAQMTDGEKAALEHREAHIDKGIRKHSVYSDTNIYVSMGGGGVTRRMRDELSRRYEAAGWVVKWNDDQRDGLSIQLQPKTAT
jgi:hypothetical protein